MKVLLKTGEEKELLKGVYMDKKPNALIGLEFTLKLVPVITPSRRTSWNTSQRWSSAWTNLTTRTT